MGRVYDTIVSNSKSLHSLFDTGAVHNYITKKAAEGLPVNRLSKPYTVGIGGESRTIVEVCLIDGELGGNKLFFYAPIVEELGMDERNKEIDILFGATEMQRWNIKIDPKEEKLDLSRFRKEFIEYCEFYAWRATSQASRTTNHMPRKTTHKEVLYEIC